MVNIANYSTKFINNRNKWSKLFQENLPDTADYLIGVENYHLIKQVWLEEYQKAGLPKLDHQVEYITQILGKILIPDSFFPTLQNARLLAEKIPNDKDSYEILELCTGAGISTMMTWSEIKKKYPATKCCITSIDVSHEALLLAETLLRFIEIPVLRIHDKNSPPPVFDGIILINDEAARIVDDLVSQERKFDAIFSDHGIGYFEKEEHSRIVNGTTSLLAPGGTFFTHSLEDKVKVSLSYPKMIGNILFNKDLLSSLPDDEQPYDYQLMGDFVRVTGFHTKESAGFYKILQELLFSGKISDFLSYIKSVSEVAKTTKKLAAEVKSPTLFTRELLENSEICPSYDRREHSVSRTVWYKN